MRLFKGQFDRCLNKASSESQAGRPAVVREEVTCTDDLGVTMSRAEAAELHEQSISSIVRTEFIRGRRNFRRMAVAREADGFLSNLLNSPGRPNCGRSNGGSARSRSDRVAWQERSPVVVRGPSHILQTSRRGHS